VFAGAVRDFDTESLPDDPAELFESWLREAVEEGVPERHAMTLSPSDPTGAPDARAVAAHTVQSWQADEDRQHTRVQYHRQADRWTHTLLWP
jgi:pyridoxamine 5'-phosphate oxidase